MNWFRGMAPGYGKKKQRCQHIKRIRQRRMDCIPLNEAMENENYIILSNPDKKTNEMGLHAGAMIIIMKNNGNDSNIIVAISDSRYIIPREMAASIRVK
jgi:Fe2+ transport system protein FeoA